MSNQEPQKVGDLIPQSLENLSHLERIPSPEPEKKLDYLSLAKAELKKICLGNRYLDLDETKIRNLVTIKAWLKLFLSGDKRGAVFTGDRGSGKTSILHWIALKLFEYSRCQYLKNDPDPQPQRTISISIMRTSNLTRAFVQQDKETIEIAQTTPIVMLDDFARHYQHDFPTSMLEDLIEFRYANELPTFIAMDISLQALGQQEKWEAMVDRFRDSKWMYGALSL